MKRITLVVVALCGCALLADPPCSQSLQSPQTQQAIAKASTRLVQVNVIVQDKKGQPVTGLTADDFEIRDQGKPQKISVFSVESNQQPVAGPATLPAGTFSNLPAQAGAPHNLTVILFDTLNTPDADQATAKSGLIDFLRELQPQDRVAIYGLGNTLHVIQEFTGNSESLVRAISRYKAHITKELAGSAAEVVDNTSLAQDAQERAVIEQMDKFLNESNQLAADVYIERRMALTLQALESISHHLTALPGRKSLVWVSGAFPFSYGKDTFEVNQANPGSKNFLNVISRVAQAITNANVAIYPVDARGFMSTSVLNPSTSAATTLNSARQAQRTDAGVMDQLLSSRSTMNELADKTGGRALYNTSDVHGAIRQALDDSRVTYTLGYYPSDTNFNGRFRTIKVAVNRPGTQLRYRLGYFAFPDQPMDDSHRQGAISDAARGPLDASALGFVARVKKPSAGSTRWEFALDIDIKSMTLEPEQDSWTGGMDLVFAQLGSSGEIVTSVVRPIPLKFTAAQREQLLKDGLVLNIPFDINAKSDRLRIILRDARSGALGSLTIPLQ
jgi:VWFA-related protein